MTDTIDIVYVESDGWKAVYIDNHLAVEDHGIFDHHRKAEEIFSYIPGVRFSTHTHNWGEGIAEYLDQHGSYPEHLTVLNQWLASYKEEE